MNEDNGIEELWDEIEDLKKRVDQQMTYNGILAVLIIVLVIFYGLVNSTGFLYFALILVLILPIAVACRLLEKRGI